MKSEKQLNHLFDALKNEKPQVSFEEISMNFRQYADSGIRKIHLQKNQLSTLKKLIMILSVITTAVLSIFLFSDHSKEIEEENNNHTSEHTNPIEERNIDKKDNNLIALPAFPENKTTSYTEEKTESEFFLQPILIEKNNDEASMHISTTQIKLEDKSSNIPILTDEEKAATEREKKKMMKQFEKMDKKNYAFIPSGKFSLNDSTISVRAFYMSTTEITNLQYRTFLYDLLIQNKEEDFLIAKPVQSNWTKMFGESNLAMEEQYFTHPAYNEYPVVNISRTGAEMYCAWLTAEVNSYLKSRNKTPIQPIRLPLRTEWMHAAGGTSVFPWKGDKTVNDQGCYLANYKPFDDNNFIDGGYYTVKVNSYLPNEFGLYNMAGNAAEMVYESIKTKEAGTAGGGWLSSEDELKILGTDLYQNQTEAHPNIGFRIVFSFN
ncbi:MAG: SUMF1/EgtB/PvdO family nonheme iron enzyme [Crocinitomicaceae bacterium]|nr:SUMF1/EgtB/PvdO family nonheme iron enzyme [Crocinitomicaceae bacterium]